MFCQIEASVQIIRLLYIWNRGFWRYKLSVLGPIRFIQVWQTQQEHTQKFMEEVFYTFLSLPYLLSPSVPSSALPLVFSTFFLPFPFPLLRSTAPVNQLEGWGSDVSSPEGSGTVPRPKTNLVHPRAARKPPLAIILSIVDRSKFSTN